MPILDFPNPIAIIPTMEAMDKLGLALRQGMFKNMKKKKADPVEAFIALPDEEKNRIVANLVAESPEQRLARSRPMNAKERAWWKKFKQANKAQKRGAGRPKIGAGAMKISVSIERSLMHRADAWAKTHGLKRSELVAMGIANLIGA